MPVPPTSPVWPPTTSTMYGMVAVLVLAGAMLVLCRPLLARTAQHGNPSTTDMPPDHRALGTPGFLAAVAASTLLAGVAVIGWAPPVAWPVWCGIVTLGVLLGWIDAATTWLPSALVHPLWLLTGLGAVGSVPLGLLIDPAHWWLPALTAIIGALGYGAFFALVWRIGRGGLGFGDVRLAVALGAATGACSPTTALLGAVLGTSLGAIWASGRLLRGRREPFPYGPFLLVGALLAPMLDRVIT